MTIKEKANYRDLLIFYEFNMHTALSTSRDFLRRNNLNCLCLH